MRVMDAPDIRTIDGSAPHEHGLAWLDVPYADKDGRSLRLQVIWPPIADWSAPTRFPTVVFVQGSGWQEQMLGQWLLALAEFARRGYVVAIVEHRPSTDAPFPAQVKDLRTAVRFLRDHAERYRVDTERIVLWGDSSGGHIVVLAALTDGDPAFTDEADAAPLGVRAVVTYYGPSDIGLMADDPACSLLIGGADVRTNPELTAPTVAMNHIRPASEAGTLPPLLILHGDQDEVVPLEQGLLLHDSLRQAGHPVQTFVLKGAAHGAGAFWTHETLDLVDQFLRDSVTR
jgi:acetyl esterase/lipase